MRLRSLLMRARVAYSDALDLRVADLLRRDQPGGES